MVRLQIRNHGTEISKNWWTTANYESAWTLGVRGELAKTTAQSAGIFDTSGSSVGPRSITTGAFGSAFASWRCQGVPARNSSCTGEGAVP